MNNTKSDSDILKLIELGKISKQILDDTLRFALPGVKLLKIDEFAESLMSKFGVDSWFKDVKNYPKAIITSVNDVWIHGIPDSYILKVGDVISIDIGIKKDGLYLDNCWTVVSNSENRLEEDIRSAFTHSDVEITRFLRLGVEHLNLAISNCKIGGRIGDISASMQKVEKYGYSVIRDYTGHGVGYSPHELPEVPCFGTFGAGPKIKNNMVLAIEIMYTMGDFTTKMNRNGWGISTKDAKISAMFEHSVLSRQNGPLILT